MYLFLLYDNTNIGGNMKKNNIVLISIIVIILISLCTIAGTYAVVINVVSDNGVDKIVNTIEIKDLLSNDNGTYNTTYYQVKNELNVTDEEMSILINSKELNSKLKLVLDSIVKYKLRKDTTSRYSDDEIYNMIIDSMNNSLDINNELKNKVIITSGRYKEDISNFLYDIDVSLLED